MVAALRIVATLKGSPHMWGGPFRPAEKPM
jgi:hypothetical protein